MIRILQNEEMRQADEYTIRILNVPSLELMERAGAALADVAEKLSKKGKIVCVCGGGNNGGDGFVCARKLKEKGYEVSVMCIAEKFSGDCAENRARWEKTGGKIEKEIPNDCALIVDCLFGTGFKGALKERETTLVQQIQTLQKQGTKVLSADIPSGISGKNGLKCGEAVYADQTVCIGEVKVGNVFADGLDHSGKMVVADIGISLPKPHSDYAYALDGADVAKRLPTRCRNSHKGTYGRAAIVAGSMEYTGAAYLSAAACLRSGCGYTTLFVPAKILPYYVLRVPEILLKPLCEGDCCAFNEEKFAALLGFDSIAYGMGMGISEDVAKGAKYLLENFTGRLILDADGIDSLAAYERDGLAEILKNKKCDVLLTPHTKEFARLSGESVEEILDSPLTKPRVFSEKYGVCVLLKNASSVITDGKRIVVNTTGNSGLAKGGSGDVLSGLIAGLCARGCSAFDGGCIGAYLLGKTAEIAAKTIGEEALIASDILAKLGEAFLWVKNSAVSEDTNENGREE